MKAAVKKTGGKLAPGVNVSSSPFCLSVQEMGTGQAVRCLSQSPWDWGSGEAWREKGFIHANVTLSDIAVRRCAITSLPLQSPSCTVQSSPLHIWAVRWSMAGRRLRHQCWDQQSSCKNYTGDLPPYIQFNSWINTELEQSGEVGGTLIQILICWRVWSETQSHELLNHIKLCTHNKYCQIFLIKTGSC